MSGFMTWLTIEDGVVITKKMGDDAVWRRCDLFGRSRLIEALEDWLKETETCLSNSHF